MRNCPNSSYNEIPCPYALSEVAPVPCVGSSEQCEDWRNQCKSLLEQGKVETEDLREKIRNL
tara:strand:- start:1168 stop:1353 length:186 start_codon:yes stop_codon:yes gene_type:complete